MFCVVKMQRCRAGEQTGSGKIMSALACEADSAVTHLMYQYQVPKQLECCRVVSVTYVQAFLAAMSLPLVADLLHDSEDLRVRQRIRSYALQLLPSMLHGSSVVLAEEGVFSAANVTTCTCADKHSISAEGVAAQVLVRARACPPAAHSPARHSNVRIKCRF